MKLNPELSLIDPAARGTGIFNVPPESLLDPGIAFLPKPFAPDALLRRVRELLDSPGRGRSASRTA